MGTEALLHGVKGFTQKSAYLGKSNCTVLVLCRTSLQWQVKSIVCRKRLATSLSDLRSVPSFCFLAWVFLEGTPQNSKGRFYIYSSIFGCIRIKAKDRAKSLPLGTALSIRAIKRHLAKCSCVSAAALLSQCRLHWVALHSTLFVVSFAPTCGHFSRHTDGKWSNWYHADIM